MKGKILFILWSLFIIPIWIFNSDFRTMMTSVILLFCGGCALIFWAIRNPLRKHVEKWSISPKTKFVLIGSFGAWYVETVFWIIDQLVGVIGLAASPNLLLDYIMTMPWYILMLILLFKSETKVKFSWFEIFLLGGLYDLFADGIVGNIVGVITNPSIIILLIMGFPLFTLTYVLIVLPTSYLIEEEIDKLRLENEKEHTNSKLKWALYPLLGLLIIPITVLMISLFTVLF